MPEPARTSQTAVILTALDVETNAVLRHLSGVSTETVSGTGFFRGQFEGWDVAVAEVGAGNVGATAITVRACEHYKPRVALFVGVAGGVKDVAIGDVVVATKVYGYESRKDGTAGFQARPTLLISAHALEQRARIVRQTENWQARLDQQIGHGNPTLFVGPIAAGEKVVASKRASTAELLCEYYGDTLAIEMEGRGFLEGVHVNYPVQGCVVRGISDLLDGKADADKAGSQERAADVASAVAFEMLATLQPAGAARTSADTRDELSAPHEKNAEERRTGTAPKKPSANGQHSTVIFAHRFAGAFPGVRAIEWFDDAATIKQRLTKLLEEPLEYADITPIWWSRGNSNLQITSFVDEGDRYVLNGDEMSIRRIAAVGSRSYKHQFVYVEVAPLPETGLYPHTADRIAEVERGDGDYTWYWEEFGLVDGKHLVTRDVYDDGSAVIDGRLQSIQGRAECRSRHVTPYNFVIAAGGAPILSMNYDEKLEGHLDAMLKGEDRLSIIVQEALTLPAGRW